MTRPLRLEFPGALYHVTSRGDRCGIIFRDDRDREAWLEVLRTVCMRCHFVVHVYCQMTNHYHLMIETVEGNLSQGMRQLNGIYTQQFNRRHGLVGHVLQGRYKAILVQKEANLLELARYIVLNPDTALRLMSSTPVAPARATIGPVRLQGYSRAASLGVGDAAAQRRMMWTSRRSVEGADGPAVTTSSMAYDQSWIPQSHLQRPTSKRIKSGGPSRATTVKR